ncbi:MAG: radical SAM protein [Clostridia bacterium]|nr:radical SAM protein [Clostridia bacterium]
MAEPVMSKYMHEKGCRLGLPISGSFELTPRCNFNCKMCYVHLSKEEAERRGRELSAQEWLGIAKEAKDRGMLFVLLTGGEPLLREDFRYIFTELQKMGLMIAVNTNASLIDDGYFEFFMKHRPMRLNISLYGTSDDTYEELTGNRCSQKVIGNIKRLKEAGIAVKLNVLIGPLNVSDTDGIRRISEETGIPIKSTTYLYPPMRVDAGSAGTNKARFPAHEAARYQMIFDKQRFSREEFAMRTVAICRGARTETSDEDCDGVPYEGVNCRAGRSSFWMTWDGRMMPCGMMTEPVAYPLRDGFDKAWSEIRDATARITLPHECSTCKMRNICHVCAASAYAESGRFNGKPQYICDMVSKLADLYREEYAAMNASGELKMTFPEADNK